MPENLQIKKCKNCNTEFKGNFCNNCGQKADIAQINIYFFLNEIGGSIFYTDRGFIYTIKELLIRPGKAIKDFINGKRVNYFKPVAFVLIFSILYSLLLHLFNSSTELETLFSGVLAGITDDNQNEGSSPVNIIKWLMNNYAYSTLLLIPVFSLASFLSFIKSKVNYSKNLVFNIYLVGEISLFLIVLLPLTILFEESYILILIFSKIIIVISYTLFAYFQFFNHLKKSSRIINVVLTFILFLIFSLFIMGGIILKAIGII